MKFWYRYYREQSCEIIQMSPFKDFSQEILFLALEATLFGGVEQFVQF